MRTNRSRVRPPRARTPSQTLAFGEMAEAMSGLHTELLALRGVSGEAKTAAHAHMVLAHNVAMLLEKLNAEKPLVAAAASAAALGDVSFNVGRLREELAAAIERRPNRVLLEIVHGLRTTRFELSEVQEQLRRNNELLERLMRDGIPTALPRRLGPGPLLGGAPAIR